MQKLLLLAIFTFLTLYSAQAQVVVSADITTNTTWTSDNVYVLSGVQFVYVKNNATLTIQPGTVIRGDQTGLVVTRGSKIIADGTTSRPIVFTSNKPAGQRTAGDWGGLALLGKAKTNKPGGEGVLEGGVDATLGLYGGTDDADNSGILRYVRIEFAGIAFQPNNETNGLTLGGVGNGTILEHIQSSLGGDDAFEWFGGSVNGKYFVTYKAVDDMFDTDNGYSGKNQFLLGISDPNIADISGSNGFESDNDATGTANTPITNAIFSNVSIFGPKKLPSTVINTNFRRGAHLRRSTSQSVHNSVFTGFPVGLRLESTNTENSFLTSGLLKLKNNIWAGCPKTVDSTSIASLTTVTDTLVKYNLVFANTTDVKVSAATNLDSLNFLPQTGSPLLSGADFAGLDPYFTPTTYKGAFGTTDWTRCWTEFDPINADYTKSIDYLFGIPTTFASAITNNKVVFTAPTGAGYTYLWAFGDGATSTAANPTHIYSTLGSFSVSLTITTNRGCTTNIGKTINITTAINEIAAINSLQLLPNPASTEANLQFVSSENFNALVSIYDIAGRSLFAETKNISTGENNIRLNISAFDSGLYLVKIQNGSGIATLKLSIVK